MLEKIRALAMEKLASEAEVNAFMAGFEKAVMEKTASVFGNIGQQLTDPRNALVGKAIVGLGASLLGAGIVKGMSSIGTHMESSALRSKFTMALGQAKSSNRLLKSAKPEKVDEYAETIFKFAPHVASDPNLLSNILGNVVQGESIDVNTVKMLVDLESRYADMHKTFGTPNLSIGARG